MGAEVFVEDFHCGFGLLKDACKLIVSCQGDVPISVPGKKTLKRYRVKGTPPCRSCPWLFID